MNFLLLWASLVSQTVKNLPAMGRPGFEPWVRKIPWRGKWLPTPVFFPGECHRQRDLIAKRLDWMTNTFTSCYLDNSGREIWNKKQEEEFIGEENLLNFRYHEYKMLDHPRGKMANNFPGQPNPFPWFQLLSVC